MAPGDAIRLWSVLFGRWVIFVNCSRFVQFFCSLFQDESMLEKIPPLPRKNKKIIFLYCCLCIILIGGFLEIGLRVYHYKKYDAWRSAAEVSHPYAYTRLFERQPGCAWTSYYPSPWLGFVHRDRPACDQELINNIGILKSRDFTFKKSPDTYKVLVTGGSVAAQYVRQSDSGHIYLEDTLNLCYHPPRGKKRFGVWGGAVSAWKQPQQAIMTLLYGGEFDGVMSLEGFNETRVFIHNFWRLDVMWPPRRFASINPLATNRFSSLIKSWLIAKIKRLPIIRHAHLSEMLLKDTRPPIIGADYERHYGFPAGWSAEEKDAYNTRAYLRRVRAFHSIATAYGLDFALFIQPVPAISKRLTAREKALVGDLSYTESYLKMHRSLLSLNREGIPIVSLLDVFKSIEYDIYNDQIHYYPPDYPHADNNNNKKTGDKVVNEKIAAHLARHWNFERRQDAPASCPSAV